MAGMENSHTLDKDGSSSKDDYFRRMLNEYPKTDESSSLTVQDGNDQGGSWTDGLSEDAVIGGLADCAAKHLAFKFTNPMVQSLAYQTSQTVMLEVAELVFDGLSGAASGNASGLSIAQLKEMVKNVLKKLDTILDEPPKSCGDFIDMALQAIEHNCPKDAKTHFKKALENAVKGFNYATGQGKPEAMVSIMRLRIFAEMTLATFDVEDGIFLRLQNPKVNQERIFNIIRENLDKLIRELKKLKNMDWFTWQETFEARNQNVLDKLLRQLLPTLVQLKSNEFSKKTSTPESSFQMVIAPRFVPQGHEDAAVVANKDFSVALWKQKTRMHISFGGKICYYPFTNEELEVVIKVDMVKLELGIDGQTKDCRSISPALTEPVLTEIIQNQNIQMFFHVANLIDTRMLGESLLRTACEFGPASCVDFILEKSQRGVDVDFNSMSVLEFYSPLFAAAANGHDDIVKLLVQKYHADVNESGLQNPGVCALSKAIQFNHISTVKTLVQLGAGNQKSDLVSKIMYLSHVQPVVVSSSASLVTVKGHFIGDCNDREEIVRYLTDCGIKIFLTLPQ